MKKAIQIHNATDLAKEKAKLRLTVKYQQKDLIGLLLKFPGEFLSKGIKDLIPKIAGNKLLEKALNGFKILLGGTMNKLFVPKQQKQVQKAYLFGPLKQLGLFASAYKAFKMIRKYRVIR